MTADPIAGIIYPVRSIAPDITATMKPSIDAIGALMPHMVSTRLASNLGPGFTGAAVVMVTSPTVVGDGVQKYKITGACGPITGTVSGDVFALAIACDGASLRSAFLTIGANASYKYAGAATICVTHVPAAGSHTYTLSLGMLAATGTAQLGAADNPIEIIVEKVS